jgi:hypothetical protein
MRIAYRIELMRDGQVKALARELVATVGLLMKKRASSILRGFQEREMTRASARELKRVGALITSCGLGSSSR